MISPLFCLFWTLFGQFLGTFPIWPVLIIPWLLNWIIFWIELPEFILNWIIFWIESWVNQYWIEYWMNHFLAKFKYWIESDWVLPTTTLNRFLVLSVLLAMARNFGTLTLSCLLTTSPGCWTSPRINLVSDKTPTKNYYIPDLIIKQFYQNNQANSWKMSQIM